MNKNIKIALVVLGVILVGVFVVLATKKPILTEDILIKENKDELETEESNVLVTDEEPEEPEEPEELEELVNEDTEKQEKKDEEVVVVEEEKTINNFIQCLKEKGVIIYGSEWCPYCKSLAERLGGYDVVIPIYVECTVEIEITI